MNFPPAAGAPSCPADLMPLLAEFGIDADWLAERCLVPYPEASTLVVAERDADGREHRLTPAATEAWAALQTAAAESGITLNLASAYRSIQRQAEICRNKQATGLTSAEIFAQSAPPGFSEHHTGCAIDLATPGCPPLTEAFADTPAFAWLQRHARHYGFSLSFPRGNAQGFAFEPWHWCFAPTP